MPCDRGHRVRPSGLFPTYPDGFKMKIQLRMTHKTTSIQVAMNAMETCGIEEPATTADQSRTYVSSYYEGNGDTKFVHSEQTTNIRDCTNPVT